MAMEDIIKFIHRDKGNEWFVYAGCMRIYLRIEQRYLNRNKFQTLDIATISINDKRNRSKGIFSDFLSSIIKYCELCTDVEAIYIENVLDERFANFFRKKNILSVGT